MPEADIRRALDLFGGHLEFSTVEGVLPGWVAGELDDWLQGVEATAGELLEANGCPQVHVRATNATWTNVRLSPLRNGDVLATLPAGLLVRLWTAYRLLLNYGQGDEIPIALIASLEDPVDANRPTPPRLRPLLRDYIDAETWWAEMEFLDRSLANHDCDEDAAILMLRSLEVVLDHEVAHVLRRHVATTTFFGDIEVAPGLEGLQVRRAFEVDADHIAGCLLGAARRHLGQDDLDGSLRVLTVAVSNLLALFDPVYLRVFDDFRATDYYHPKVRRGTILGGVRKTLAEIDSGRISAAFSDGISWFETAASRLEVDALRGKFGEMPVGHGAPIINPLRSLAFQPTYDDDVDAAERDLAWAEELYRSCYPDIRVPLAPH